MTYIVRDAKPEDAEVITDFNQRLCRETEDHELVPDTIRRGVANLLADRTKGRYWVAVDNETVIGQILVTYEWSDWRNGMLWWIGSVYVHKDHRRRGVYSTLYRHVEEQARATSDVAGLRLYVEKDNQRAQSTYEHLGMSHSGYRIMETIF